MKKSILLKFFLLFLFFILFFCTSSLIFGITNNDLKNKNITTIDLTGLITGEDANHTHIFIHKFDKSSHWEECVLCKQIQNKNSHNLEKTGSGECETYYTTYCHYCGYSFSEYIDHHIHYYSKEEIINNGGYHTNTVTYYHNIGKCDKCGSTTATEKNGKMSNELCFDENGNRISCINRKKCIICGYDYSKLSIISHHSAYSDKREHYNCNYCGTPIYSELYYSQVQDPLNDLHWTMYGIYKLEDEVKWNSKNIPAKTWSPMLSSGALTLTSAKIEPLPSNYYNNPQYNTVGFYDNLYLVSYEANIKNGFQGTISLTRMNADNIFTNINGDNNQYAKSYSTHGINLTPDSEAPKNLSVNIIGNGTKNNYSNTAYLELSCTDNYSDYVSFALYDDKNNIVIDYKTVNKLNDKFSVVLDFSEGNIEINENAKYYIYYKDRYENINKKEINLSYIDTKAPELVSEKQYINNWTQAKEVSIQASDYGVGNNGYGNVLIGFNNQNDLTLANNLTNNIFNKNYQFIGDVYDSVIGAVYLKDSLNNIRTEFIEVGKLDNTAPTITKVSHVLDQNEPFGTLTIDEANDINSKLNKEGSGIIGYAMVYNNKEIPNKNMFTNSNQFKITENGTYYIYAIDLVGNISKPLEYSVSDIIKGNIYIKISKKIKDKNNNILHNKDLYNQYGFNNNDLIFNITLINKDTNKRYKSSIENNDIINFFNISTGIYEILEQNKINFIFEDINKKENNNSNIKFLKENNKYYIIVNKVLNEDQIIELESISLINSNVMNKNDFKNNYIILK